MTAASVVSVRRLGAAALPAPVLRVDLRVAVLVCWSLVLAALDGWGQSLVPVVVLAVWCPVVVAGLGVSGLTCPSLETKGACW